MDGFNPVIGNDESVQLFYKITKFQINLDTRRTLAEKISRIISKLRYGTALLIKLAPEGLSVELHSSQRQTLWGSFFISNHKL